MQTKREGLDRGGLEIEGDTSAVAGPLERNIYAAATTRQEFDRKVELLQNDENATPSKGEERGPANGM